MIIDLRTVDIISTTLAKNAQPAAQHTFVCVLIKPAKGIDLVIPAIRYGSIDKASRPLPASLSHLWFIHVTR